MNLPSRFNCPICESGELVQSPQDPEKYRCSFCWIDAFIDLDLKQVVFRDYIYCVEFTCPIVVEDS